MNALEILNILAPTFEDFGNHFSYDFEVICFEYQGDSYELFRRHSDIVMTINGDEYGVSLNIEQATNDKVIEFGDAIIEFIECGGVEEWDDEDFEEDEE